MQKNEQSNFPGLLGFILARLLGTPSLRETKGFTEETEERIPRLQTRHVGVSTSVIALLFVAGWVFLPRDWALTGSVATAVVGYVTVAMWGARVEHRKDLKAVDDFAWTGERTSLVKLLLGVIFTRQFWALLGPFALTGLTYYMQSLPDAWFTTRRQLSLFAVALATGLVVAGMLRVYFYGRETFVRHEMTPERERLYDVLDEYLDPALEREIGLMGTTLPTPVDEALRRVQEEVQQGLLTVQRVAPLVRGPTVAESMQRAVMKWQLDLLQLMWMMDRVGYGRRDLTDRYREQYGENIVLPLTGMEITEPACRTLCSYLRAGRVLIQEVGGRPKLNPEHDPATLLGLVGSIALPDNRKPAV